MMRDGGFSSLLPRPSPHLAAPSWVIPGTIYENCSFLADKVDEVALLFFETASSLAYTRQDLPSELADLGLSYHVHLPLDLPWEEGGERVAAICLALMDKTAFLGAARAVLHPPPAGGDAARVEEFAAAWQKSGRATADVLLENIRGNDLSELWSCMRDTGLGLCLDLGHMLAYEQVRLQHYILTHLLPEDVRPRMVHLNAPGSGEPGEPPGAHLPLDRLDEYGMALGKALSFSLSPGGVVVAEFFDWGHVERSLPLINQWFCQGATRCDTEQA